VLSFWDRPFTGLPVQIVKKAKFGKSWKKQFQKRTNSQKGKSQNFPRKFAHGPKMAN
jgi:hypothetical protein